MKFIVLVDKQVSLYSDMGMSERIKKHFFLLCHWPYSVYVVLEVRAWNGKGLVSLQTLLL